MRLFRSEEEVDGEDGAMVPIGTLAALARDWYGDRLDPDWRPRTVGQSQAILDRHGLTGPFWRLG
ncbi:MAG: hypothetical protein ACRDK0_14845 [Solirubrobacteraceae bacterium]